MLVLSEIKENAGYIVLNRPEKRNAFNREMSLALQDALDVFAGNEEVRVVVISGAGKAFSAGQDISGALQPGEGKVEDILKEQYNPIITSIRNMPKPVVALVRGSAAGAGANIALACDIVLADQTAVFTQAFSKIGLIPDSGGTWLLPRLVGWQRALALAITGDPVSADEAVQMGMVYKSFSEEKFETETSAFVNRLAAMPTKAVALIKKAFQQSGDNSLEEQLRLEDMLQQQALRTHDFQEGVRAFMEKRNPSFKGK